MHLTVPLIYRKYNDYRINGKYYSFSRYKKCDIFFYLLVDEIESKGNDKREKDMNRNEKTENRNENRISKSKSCPPWHGQNIDLVL